MARKKDDEEEDGPSGGSGRQTVHVPMSDELHAQLTEVAVAQERSVVAQTRVFVKDGLRRLDEEQRAGREPRAGRRA